MRKKILTISLVTIGAILLVWLTVFLIKFFGLNKKRFQVSNNDIVAGEEIKLPETIYVIAENSTKKLSIDPETMNVILEDKKTGMKWESVVTDSQNELDLSLLNISYVGADNSFEEWDSYTQVLLTDSAKYYSIPNGIRILMNFNEGESKRFFEYLPVKMSPEHYKFIWDGLQEAIDNGTLTERVGTRYQTTLELIYTKNIQEDFYDCKTYPNTPAKSAVEQLINITKIVGYDKDMLMQDAKDYGFTVTFEEPAIFDIALDLYLDGDDFIAEVPVSQIVSENSYYKLVSIDVLPNFAAVTAPQVTEGYLMVPDGCGALIKMNSFNAKVPAYTRPLYDGDFYNDYYYKPEYETELMMPVYGIIYEQGEKDPFGVLGIIETGDYYCNINAKLGSSGAETNNNYCNKVFPTYNVSQYKWVPVFGEYAENQTTFLSVSPVSDKNLKIRIKTYTGNQANYFTMAKDFGSWLSAGKEQNTYLDSAKLFLEVHGTLSTTEKFIGIPYPSKYSMTTYKELMDIVNDLSGVNLNVSYLGAFDEGENNALMNHGTLVKNNGSKTDLAELKALIESRNGSLFLGTNFTEVYNTKKNGFWTAMTANKDYSKSAVQVYGYSVSLGKFKQATNTYTQLSPSYLYDTVGDFIKRNQAKDYDLLITDLTSKYYAEYGNNYTSPAESQLIVDKSLALLNEGKKLALTAPWADKIGFGTVATDIPRNSAEYSTFYATIPFYQLALNGICEYTTTSANNTSYSLDYFLMQALETGSELKLMLSSKSVDKLRDSEYAYLYSMQYELLKDDIKAITEKYNEAMMTIGKTKIVNHRMVGENVFETSYENGTKILSNYNGSDVTVEGRTVPALGYIIIK